MTSALPSPGDVLAGAYRVERVLGRGGFGVTVAARELEGGRLVAVKQLDLRNVDDWKSVELFEREAEVLSRLNHPAIPKYVAFVPIAADQAGLLVQELAPGMSLQAHLDANRIFTEEEVRQIARQVLEVLIYLAALDPVVVHRDIKPANLVMDEAGTVRVVDFGSVKEAAARASTIGSTVAGTFGYMGPEQIQGGAEPRSDLYSIGMTMIALLTGSSPTDLPRKRLKPDYRRLVKISSPLARFIDRLIEPVPDDRFADPATAKDALEDAIVEATLADPGADIGAMVAAKELAERQARRKAALAQREERDTSTAKLAQRDDRVAVAEEEGRLQIRIRPKFLVDKLKEQLPWGFGFAFINPGVFIVMGIGAILIAGMELPFVWGALLSVFLWMLLLTAFNVVYALWTRRALVLDVTEKGDFALYEKNPKSPILLGRKGELEVRIDEPDPSRLGDARFEDRRHRVDVDKLSARDLKALRQALRRRVRMD